MNECEDKPDRKCDEFIDWLYENIVKVPDTAEERPQEWELRMKLVELREFIEKCEAEAIGLRLAELLKWVRREQ